MPNNGVYEDDALLSLINDKILPLEMEVNHDRAVDEEDIQKLMNILKDDEVLELLGIVHKTLYPYYIHYANSEGLMQFKQFCKFCSNFGIFPDYLPKAKLYKFFHTLSGFYKENSK
jgi:hypothetical protein